MKSNTDSVAGANNHFAIERASNSMALSAGETRLSFGTVATAESNVEFSPELSLFNRHMMIAGGTRGGKSKLYEHLARQLIENGCGFAFVDPHSVSADELFAYLAYHYDELGFVRANIHYLNPKERLFAYDPFRFHGGSHTSDFMYRVWLHNKCKAMIRIIVRQQGESEDEAQKMVRLRRWLYNGLYAVGVRDADGHHLPLSDIFILLNPQHRRHEELYQYVRSFLTEQVRADFEKLRRTKDPRKQEDWVESSLNRLREMLSDLIALIFDTQNHPAIDFTEIMRRDGIILASLGTSPYFDTDESHVLAGLIILELRDAAQATANESRRNYYLWIDEAHHFLGEDIDKMLVESAKYRISIGLAFQDLAKLQKGELDLLPTVISQCGVRITFQQQFHMHAEILGKSLCGRNYDFEPLFNIADRPDGHDLVVLQSETHGTSEGRSTQQGRSLSRGISRSKTQSRSTATGRTDSHGTSRQIGQSTSQQHSHGQSQTHTDGENHSTSNQQSSTSSSSQSQGTGTGQTVSGSGPGQRMSESASSNHGLSSGISQSESFGSSEGYSSSDSTGLSHSQSAGVSLSGQFGATSGHSNSHTDTTGFSIGDSVNFGESETESAGQNEGWNHSVSTNPTLVARTREEWQLTGRLRNSIADQTARFAAMIMSLPQQHCLVSLASRKAFVVRVDDVYDPFEVASFSPEARQAAIEFVKKAVYSTQPYYFLPTDDAFCCQSCGDSESAMAAAIAVLDDPNDPFAF